MVAKKVKRRQHAKPRIIVQHHHITYDPEWVVPIYKGEHMILTRIQWRKRFSVGFRTALIHFIETHTFVDLEAKI